MSCSADADGARSAARRRVFTLLPELLRGSANWRYVLFAAAVIVLMALRPQGLLTGEQIRRLLGIDRQRPPAGRCRAGAGRMTHGPPILRLERVTKRFGGMTAIDDLCFDVRRGSRTALIGPNGAGKTTVFNIVTGAVPIDAGHVFVDGADISRVPSRRRIRHGVARSFQNVRLMPHLTTLENVMVGQHCHNAGLLGVLQPVNLWPRNRWREAARAAFAEAGLDQYAGATVKNLPYGVQKRVEVVRAMMAKPRLLLLDEPAAGLNSAETEALKSLLGTDLRERGV